MIRFVIVALLSFVFAACLTLGESEASGCRVVQLVAPPAVVSTPPVSYGHQRVFDYPFVASTFVPFPVYVPSYTVQYGGSVGGDPAMLAEVKRLGDQVAALTAKYEGIRAPERLTAPPPETKGPAAAPGPGDIAGVLTDCAACHDSGVAKVKGQGFVLAENGKSRPLSPAEALKALRRVEDGEMPPGRPLDAGRKGAFRKWILGSN